MKPKSIILLLTPFMCAIIGTALTTNCTAINRPTSNTQIFPLAQASPESIRVLSYNIRGPRSLDDQNNNGWEVRKEGIFCLLEQYTPDIIALQEVSCSYTAIIEQRFPEYEAIAFDIDSKNKDVYFLIRKDRFLVEDTGCFWLSDDPLYKNRFGQPAWGGKSPRIAVYALLQDRLNNKKFVALSTHFESCTMHARINSAQVLNQQLSMFIDTLPLMLCGDFNFFQDTPALADTSAQAYALITNNNGLTDIRDLACDPNHYGPDGTWIGLPYNNHGMSNGMVGDRLDHMFVRGFSVIQEGVLNLKFDKTLTLLIDRSHTSFFKYLHPSDHLPVIADLVIY